VQGTCDGPPGTAIIVTLMDGNTVVASVTVYTDADGTWSAEFANIPQNNNYSITVQLTVGGPAVAEVTDIDVAEFSIVDPGENSELASQLSVSGFCYDLIADPALTIDVTYSPDSGTPITQPAEGDPAGTWIAYFSVLPAGDGSLTASASNGTQTDPVSGLTVSTLTNILEPVDGQDYDDIEPPPPPAPVAPVAGTIHKARGTFHKKYTKIKAYATRKGKRVAPPIPVKDDGFVTGSTTMKKWSIDMYKLFRGKANPGRYHFHLVAIRPHPNPSKPPLRHHRSAGKFRVLN
jgi:hypothetical protein